MGCAGTKPGTACESRGVPVTNPHDVICARLSQIVLVLLDRDLAGFTLQPAALRAISLILHDGIVAKSTESGPPSVLLRNGQLLQLTQCEAEQPAVSPEVWTVMLASCGRAMSIVGATQLLGLVQGVASMILAAAARRVGQRVRLEHESSSDSSDEGEVVVIRPPNARPPSPALRPVPNGPRTVKAAAQPEKQITVAGIVGCRRHPVLRRIYMGAVLGSGLLQKPDERIDSNFRRWPLAFVVHVLRDEWQFADTVANADTLENATLN